MNPVIPVIIGWTGGILYIVAYLLLCMNKLKADTFTYHLLNILGALGLIFNAFALKDAPNVIVNLIWMSIAMYAIYGLKKKQIARK